MRLCAAFRKLLIFRIIFIENRVILDLKQTPGRPGAIDRIQDRRPDREIRIIKLLGHTDRNIRNTFSLRRISEHLRGNLRHIRRQEDLPHRIRNNQASFAKFLHRIRQTDLPKLLRSRERALTHRSDPVRNPIIT